MRDKHITQVELGRRLGKTQGAVGKWLRGDIRLTLANVDEIADAMEVPAARLLQDEPSDFVQPSLEEAG